MASMIIAFFSDTMKLGKSKMGKGKKMKRLGFIGEDIRQKALDMRQKMQEPRQAILIKLNSKTSYLILLFLLNFV